MNASLRTLALCSLLLAPAVQSARLEPVQPGAVLSSKSKTFSLQPPVGWLCIEVKTHIGCARDGFMLNAITIDLRPHDKAFPNLKKTSSADAPPEELAETLVADLAAMKTLHDVKLVSVEPAEIAGHAGFRARISYRMGEEVGNALYDDLVVGAAVPAGLLLAQYEAPHLHFFETYLPAFEAVLPTITLLANPK